MSGGGTSRFIPRRHLSCDAAWRIKTKKQELYVPNWPGSRRHPSRGRTHSSALYLAANEPTEAAGGHQVECSNRQMRCDVPCSIRLSALRRADTQTPTR